MDDETIEVPSEGEDLSDEGVDELGAISGGAPINGEPDEEPEDTGSKAHEIHCLKCGELVAVIVIPAEPEMKDMVLEFRCVFCGCDHRMGLPQGYLQN